MPTSHYTVSFRHADGVEHVSRFFRTVKAARNWAKWLETQQWVEVVTIWRGLQAGGEIVT